MGSDKAWSEGQDLGEACFVPPQHGRQGGEDPSPQGVPIVVEEDHIICVEAWPQRHLLFVLAANHKTLLLLTQNGKEHLQHGIFNILTENLSLFQTLFPTLRFQQP